MQSDWSECGYTQSEKDYLDMDDRGTANRLKLGCTSNGEVQDSNPGRTDDLTSHSSDDFDSTDMSGSAKSAKSKVLNAPKRPRTAYMIFLENSKAPFFDKNPKATFNEYQKYAGQLWRSFTQDEKKPWMQSEIDSRKEFFKEIQDLQTTFGLTKAQSREVSTPQTHREHNSSATPKTAFPLYVQAMKGKLHAQNPGMSYNELQKELSKEWRTMSADDKQVWIDMARDGHKTHRIPGSSGKSSAASKKGVMLPRGPRSAYTLFYQCARKQLSEERPELSFREFPTICSQLWRNMPEEEKVLWQADAAHDRERYEKELLDMASKQSAGGPSRGRVSDSEWSSQEPQSRSSTPKSGGSGRSGNSKRNASKNVVNDDLGALFMTSPRDRSASSTWADIDIWQPLGMSTSKGVASAGSRKRKNSELVEGFSPLSPEKHSDDGDSPLHLHSELSGNDLPPLSLSLGRIYRDQSHESKEDHSAEYVDTFDDLAAEGHNIFDICGDDEDSHLHHDPLFFPIGHPSSSKSNDGMNSFLGFHHDDIFGHESSYFS